ncbi:MAG: hypothetical protein ACTHMT_09270 [Verrucomicrobiota bacterium]
MRSKYPKIVLAICSVLKLSGADVGDAVLPIEPGTGPQETSVSDQLSRALAPKPELSQTAPNLGGTETQAVGQVQPPSFFAAPPRAASSALLSSALDDLLAPQATVENPKKFGPFYATFRGNYTLTYATGLLRGPNGSETTLEHRLSPGITLQSRHLTLDYSPSLSYYSKGSYQDTVNHNASIHGNFGYDKWQFNLGYSLSIGSSPLVETATQADFEQHNLFASAAYQFSQKTSFDFTLSDSIQQTSGFNGAQTVSSMNWLNYRIADRTVIGAGVGGGYSDVDNGSDMSFEQIQGRISWTPGDKFSMSANGGVEIRQFLAINGAPDLVSPTMGAVANYYVFKYTSLSLNANRGVSTSLFQDQITENTEVSAGIGQRFLGHLHFSLTGGLRKVDYKSSSTLFLANRSDDVTFITSALSTRFLKHGNLSLAYSRNENDSSQNGFSFTSNQYSFRIGFSF